MAMSFSTTKGVIATTVHRLVDRGLIDYDEPVATYWPEFAANGKQGITVRHLLDHSAGLHTLRDVIPDAYDMLDWDLVTSKLAAAAPAYPPGTKFGYHGITFGFLVGEVIQRVTGLSVHDAVEAEIVKPLDLDGMSIGVPLDQRGRVADLLFRFGDAERTERFAQRASRLRWMRPAIDTFVVPNSDRFYASSEILDGAIPAVNGCFTARSLARMYAALAGGGVLDGERFLSAETLRRATEIQTNTLDIVVGFRMRWRLGYHMAATSRGVIPNGFGHFGFGGSGSVGRSRQRSRGGLRVQPGGRHTLWRHPVPAHRRPGPHGRNGPLSEFPQNSSGDVNSRRTPACALRERERRGVLRRDGTPTPRRGDDGEGRHLRLGRPIRVDRSGGDRDDGSTPRTRSAREVSGEDFRRHHRRAAREG